MNKIILAVVLVLAYLVFAKLTRAQSFDYVTVENGKVIDVSSATVSRQVYRIPGTTLRLGDTYKVPVSSAVTVADDGTRSIR